MLSALVLSASLLSTNQGCSPESETLGAGHIHGIHLVADESQELLLDINNGIYDYCRVMSLQTGELEFDEVSCTANVREMEAIPEYDVQVDVVSSSELLLVIDGANTTLDLNDAFVDADAFAYFYSPSMRSVFVFTAAENSSSQIDLVIVAFNVNGTDPLYAVQSDIENTGSIEDILDGELMRSFDELDLFMVEAGERGECEDTSWLRYSFVSGLYDLLASDDTEAQSNETQMAFVSIGSGYIGVDSRLSRAWGFDTHTVRYFEADGRDLSLFRTEQFELGHAELSSYWVLMWLLIALAVCCCCVCAGCYVKRRRGRSSGRSGDENQFGMSTHEMTAV